MGVVEEVIFAVLCLVRRRLTGRCAGRVSTTDVHEYQLMLYTWRLN